MYPPIFSICNSDSSVIGIFGDPVRLYANGQAPHGVTAPYATYQIISGSPENYIAGRPDADSFSMQIDVYAANGQLSQDGAEAIRDAIELYSYVTNWRGESKEDETRLYRYSFDVDWIVNR